jgi:dihydrolipoamide dehydrogenase
VDFGAPVVNIDKLRGHKEKVIGKLTGGLAAMAKMRKVTTVRGYGAFVGPTTSRWKKPPAPAGEDRHQEGGGLQARHHRRRQPGRAPALHARRPARGRQHRRAGAQEVPKRMLILGGGIIGLEMGTVYSTLGARLDVVEMLDGLMQGADRDLVKVWQKMNAKRFDNIMLKTKTVGARPRPKASRSRLQGEEGGTPPPAGVRPGAAGRGPHAQRQEDRRRQGRRGRDDRGFINVDIQMRTNVPHIFAIGDIVGQPMLAHKAVHEAHVAAEVIAGELQGNKELASAAFNARVIPSVAYTDPEVAWVGLTEDQAKAQGIKVKKGLFPWTASGRAIANGRDEGVTKLLFDDSPRRTATARSWAAASSAPMRAT